MVFTAFRVWFTRYTATAAVDLINAKNCTSRRGAVVDTCCVNFSPEIYRFSDRTKNFFGSPRVVHTPYAPPHTLRLFYILQVYTLRVCARACIPDIVCTRESIFDDKLLYSFGNWRNRRRRRAAVHTEGHGTLGVCEMCGRVRRQIRNENQEWRFGA